MHKKDDHLNLPWWLFATCPVFLLSASACSPENAVRPGYHADSLDKLFAKGYGLELVDAGEKLRAKLVHAPAERFHGAMWAHPEFQDDF